MQMNNTLGVSVPSEEQIKELKEKIDRLVNDQTLATQNATNERDQMVKALREEFNVLKKKVILDNYFNTKAEISVFRSEIQKLLIQASIETLESESAALAKCFTIQVPSIQYHIHPFQQFAATLFDKVDPNSNLDVCNKVNIVQEFLTKIRNRCTEVDTLTSGPGIMITIKDFNEILVDFCRATITDNQKQFKSRAETSSIIESHYRQSIYTKDQKIKNLENRISNIANNLNVIITSRLFEKGNALVYELDHSNRILQVFKDTMKDFEKNLVERIQGQQLEKFKRQNNHVELKNLKFQDYKQTILNMVSADFAGEQERIKTIIKEKADQAKILDKEVRNAELQMYPASGTNTKACPKCNGNSSFAGAVVPKGFTHYTHCICYKPDPRYPHPTLELAELDILSEFEARSELKQMCIFMRKQRILYRTKEMCLMSKYQNKINMLEGQQSNNSLLWNQLAESEKREKILKQELVKTQSLLGEAHKKFDNLTTEIKSLDAERCRLQNFKTRKFKRLQELEDRVKKIDVFEALSQDKLISSLAKRDSQVTTMQSSFDTLICQLKQAESKRDKDVSHYRKKLMAEQARTQSICEKMEQLQIELKMMSQNDSSVTAIWKGKCLDLFEVCTVLRKDNEDLKNRCINLINQGLQLYDTVAGGPQFSSALDDPVSSKHNLSVSSRQGNSQLPGLNNSNHNSSVMQLKQRQGLLETMRSVTPQYNNKMLTPNQQKDSRDTSRNLRFNSQQLSYISQGIHSDETNVQTNSALRKTQQEIKNSEGLSQYELVTPIGEVSRNRGMSTGQTNIIDSVQSIKGQPNSIRQILGNFTDQILSEIPAKKIEQKHSFNKTHQQLKKMNPASLGSIQDSLFHPQNSMTSTQPQNFNTNRQKQIQKNTAIQQLKEASRFSKPQTSFKQQKPFEVNAVQYQKFSHTFQTPEPTQITNLRKVVLPKSQNLNDQVNEDSYSPDPASPVILQSMEIKSLIQATRDE